jgi:hypothetical protein
MGFDWLYAALLPLFLIGVVMLAASVEERDKLWLLVLPVGAVVLVCLLTLGDPRFRHPVEPLMVVTAWFSTHVLASRLRSILFLGNRERISTTL